MHYQALAIDLDGTLLVGEALPEANRRALINAREAGLRVIIATARWKEAAFRVADATGLEEPVIACSGAQVHDRRQGTDLYDARLPEDFTAELYALCDTERCIATVTVDAKVLLKLDGEPDPAMLGEEMRWVPKLTPTLTSGAGLPRIAAIQGSAINAAIREDLAPRYQETVNVFDSIGPTGKLVSTITAKAATKGAALTAACKALALPLTRVVAFGDAENDLSMFAVCGAAVAMGQAEERVKDAATLVTGSNAEAGVAQTIEQLLARGTLS